MEGTASILRHCLESALTDRASTHMMTTRKSCRCHDRHHDRSLDLNCEFKIRTCDCHILFPGLPSRQATPSPSVLRSRQETPAVLTEVFGLAWEGPRWSPDWLSCFLSTPFQFTDHPTERNCLPIHDTVYWSWNCWGFELPPAVGFSFLLLLFLAIFTICFDEAISKWVGSLHFEWRCCPETVLR
jgi:hypothetical protein